jgi:hypothetical protein
MKHWHCHKDWKRHTSETRLASLKNAWLISSSFITSKQIPSAGIVGTFGVRALDALSPYKRHKHPDIAQQRFPDLSLGGRLNPPPELALESKGSIRPWAVQSHYDHPGWYIIWRYMVDATRTIKPGQPVVIWRVDVAFLDKSDWKYEASTAGTEGGGRTHTFGLRSPAEKLRTAAAYVYTQVVLRNGRPVLAGV